MKLLLATLAMVVLAFEAEAQTHHEEITVELVDVPVYVFNHGAAVRGLTREDFELYVNGKRQAIEYFDAIEFAAADAGAAPAVQRIEPIRDARERRLFLLLFDLVNNKPVALDRARKAAVSMVDHALPHDFFAVATCGSRGANFIIPFTRDRDVIRRALLKLSPSAAHDALAISITDAERQTMQASQPVQGGATPQESSTRAGSGAGRASSESPVGEILAVGGIYEAERSKTLVRSQFDEFAAIAGRLATLEGYKHVVLFSTGPDPYQVFADPALSSAVQRMVNSFRAAGTLLDTIDVTGVPGIAQADPSAFGPAVRGDVSSISRISPSATTHDPLSSEMLHVFADQTGGQFIHNMNDFKAALSRVSNASASGYRLAFKPVNPRRGDNAINVKVSNVPRGTTISFRKGFSTIRNSPKKPDALLLADIIQNDTPQTGTPPAIVFKERPFVDVVVPVRQLARQFGATADADVMLYVFDDKGASVLYREKRFSIPAEPRDDHAFREKLDLLPGNYVVKALLRVGTSIGFAKTAFAIPATK